MARVLMSRKKAQAIALAFFLIGLAILTLAKHWWPGIMLVIGLPLALREYLLGHRYDMFVSLFVFIGVFVTVQFNIAWEVLLPILFTLGGIYIFCREFIEIRTYSEDEKEEDLNKEIDEEDKNQQK
jgi:predicted membrane protein